MKPLTHNERVLALLSDGKPHSHHEGYRLGVMLHSRVADLRKQGHVIECDKSGGGYTYRLLGSGGGVPAGSLEPSPTGPPPDPGLSEGVHVRSRETPAVPLGAEADGATRGEMTTARVVTDSLPPSLSTVSPALVAPSFPGAYSDPPERPAPSPGKTRAVPQQLSLEDAA